MTMSSLPIYFAPLQGYTEAYYRNAHEKIFGSIDSYFTPFIRVERGGFRNRDVRDILPENNHVTHLIPQLIARDATQTEMILALFIEKGYKEVDINFGCPFPVLAKKHYGSGILAEPERIKEILAVIAKHPEIKFSVKMRLGWEDAQECMNVLPLLNEANLTHITLHPRLGKQQYKGEVDMEAFEAFYSACKHPVIYNGDLHTVEEINAIHQQFPKLKAVMIGRGLLENPALALSYKTGQVLTEEEMKDKLKAMHRLIYNDYEAQLEGGEAQLLVKVKVFWEYLDSQIGHKNWKAIKKATSIAKYQNALRQAGLF